VGSNRERATVAKEKTLGGRNRVRVGGSTRDGNKSRLPGERRMWFTLRKMGKLHLGEGSLQQECTQREDLLPSSLWVTSVKIRSRGTSAWKPHGRSSGGITNRTNHSSSAAAGKGIRTGRKSSRTKIQEQLVVFRNPTTASEE